MLRVRLWRTFHCLFIPTQVTGLAPVDPCLGIVERIAIIIKHHHLPDLDRGSVDPFQLCFPLLSFLQQI